jgi:hypothetical protein
VISDQLSVGAGFSRPVDDEPAGMFRQTRKEGKMSEKNSYALKSVCSSLAMQQIVKNNLHKSGKEYVDAFLDLACRPDDLQQLCLALFEGFTVSTDAETEIDLEKVQEGVQSFLLKVLFGSKKLPGTASA